MVNRAGDFIFIPGSVPHQPINLSASEPVRAIVACNFDLNVEGHSIPYPSLPARPAHSTVRARDFICWRQQTYRHSLSRLQCNMHAAAERHGNIHERVQREPRDAPP